MAEEITECLTPEYTEGPCHCPFHDFQTATLRDLVQRWHNREAS